MSQQPERKPRRVHGVMAEFDNAEAVVRAAQAAHDAGYRAMDAYSPYPIAGLREAIGFRKTRMPLVVFFGGVIGAIGGYFLQAYSAMVDFPLNIGGRPYHSWPAFIPITFETTILCASFAAVFGMLALNGLPQPYHPVFNVQRFTLASRAHFFLCLEARDPKFEIASASAFLGALSPLFVETVEL